MTDSRPTPPPWPEQPRPTQRRQRSGWEILAWVIGIPLLLGGLGYVGLILLLVGSHFNTVGGNK